MNLPNKLTVSRILLVPVFVLFAAYANRTHSSLMYFLACLVFSVASLTDMLDGKLARKYNLVTSFGKFADPLADKMLTTAAFLYMQQAGVCSPVVLVVILSREFAVSGLRMVAAGAKDGQVIAANIWGKAKTVLQMVSVIFFYLGNTFVSLRSMVDTVTIVLCWLCALATFLSGVIYLVQNRRYLQQ